MLSLNGTFLVSFLFLFFPFTSFAKIFPETNPALITAIANAAQTTAAIDQANLLAPSQLDKLKVDIGVAWANLLKIQADTALSNTQREQINQAILQIQLQMRLVQFEFDRIQRADYEYRRDLTTVQENLNIVKSLTLGVVSWKTWIAMDTIIMNSVDAEMIIKIMHETKIEKDIPESEFTTNDENGKVPAPNLKDHTLGELYKYLHDGNHTFKPYGIVHRYMMRILAMVSVASQIRINELQNINQQIRLTLVKYQ